MPSSSPGSANYFLALDGSPDGPHRAAAVLELLQQGTIQGTTLISREGGTEWVTVAQMQTTLRLEAKEGPPGPLPQAPVSSYSSPPPPLPVTSLTVPAPAGDDSSGAPPPHFQPPLVIAPPAPPVRSDRTKPLRFATLLGALALFFLPWVDFRCSDMKIIRQTGMQTVLSRYSFDEGVYPHVDQANRSLDQPQFSKEQLQQLTSDPDRPGKYMEIGYAWFAGGAMFCIVMGLGAALGPNGRHTAGLMALLAFVCLGVQMIAGFPMHQTKEKRTEEIKKSLGLTSKQKEEVNALLDGNKFITINYTPWFYTELGLLGFMAAVGLSGGNRRRA